MMDTAFDRPQLLSGFRVLDLTDEKGLLCGRVLGDMGADVIKVERPGGDETRRIGPFYQDSPDPEKSLSWDFYNLNKRGITLDITAADGRTIFKNLARTADCIIESFPPGFLAKLGLGYPELSRLKPDLIFTAITPFGQTGPRKDWKGSDLVEVAMGGLLYISGDPDRCPVRISYPQAFSHASVEASAATMIAHYHRTRTGEGQFIDISIQHSLVLTSIFAVPLWQVTHVNMKRVGANPGLGRMLWPCRDGFIMYQIFGGAIGARNNRALAEWMENEGEGNPAFSSIQWERFDMHMTNAAPEQMKVINSTLESVAGFFSKHTKAELYSQAVKRGMMLHPVSTAKDILEDAQLKDRDYWVEVEHPELNIKLTYPGVFIKASETPLTIRRRAPSIGEHNREIYPELGLGDKEIGELQQKGII